MLFAICCKRFWYQYINQWIIFTQWQVIGLIHWYCVSVLIETVKEIRCGKNTEVFREMDRDDFQEDCAFSIIYSDSFETLNLVAYSPDEANIWVTGLRCLVDSEKGKNACTLYGWQPHVFSPELPALFNPSFHGHFPFNQNFRFEFSATSSSEWNKFLPESFPFVQFFSWNFQNLNEWTNELSLSLMMWGVVTQSLELVAHA